MQNVLITGAAGFIGEYTVREFAQHGWHVFALVHRRTSAVLDALSEAGSVTIIHGDLNDFSTFQRNLGDMLKERDASLDTIVHCAGRASDVGRREEFRKVNYQSVRDLCGLVRRESVRRFVFVSTTDVYGMRDFHGESEDELPLRNNIRNPYPEFKIVSEEYIRNSLPKDQFAIIRPAAVWGVGDPTLTPRAVSFLRSSPWIIHFGRRRGSNRWPLAHVRNVATAIWLAATVTEAAGMAINVVDSETTSIDDFYRMVASVYLPHKELRSITLPMPLGIVFGFIVSGISNILNLDHPFTDPSLYALYSITCNLDFSNRRLLALFDSVGRQMLTRDEGLAELKNEARGLPPQSSGDGAFQQERG